MKIGLNKPYRCAKVERNQTTGRVLLCGSKILQKRCEEEGEGKCEENLAIFASVYLVHH